MNLQEQLDADFKAALKNKDEIRVRALRSIRAEVQKKELEKSGPQITDDVVRGVIQTLVKQRKDSIAIFRRGGRAELAAAEEAELAVLQTYLPAALDAAAIDAIIAAVVAQTGASTAQDLGRVMGPVMARCKQTGKTVDGKLVNQQVKAALGG